MKKNNKNQTEEPRPQGEICDGCQGSVLPPLTLRRFREANVLRCEEAFHPVYEWSPTDWATAMAGECGEACNLIKKLRRGEEVPIENIGKELADIITYADLLAARLGIDLELALIQKFNEVSDRQRPLSLVKL